MIRRRSPIKRSPIQKISTIASAAHQKGTRLIDSASVAVAHGAQLSSVVVSNVEKSVDAFAFRSSPDKRRRAGSPAPGSSRTSRRSGGNNNIRDRINQFDSASKAKANDGNDNGGGRGGRHQWSRHHSIYTHRNKQQQQQQQHDDSLSAAAGRDRDFIHEANVNPADENIIMSARREGAHSRSESIEANINKPPFIPPHSASSASHTNTTGTGYYEKENEINQQQQQQQPGYHSPFKSTTATSTTRVQVDNTIDIDIDIDGTPSAPPSSSYSHYNAFTTKEGIKKLSPNFRRSKQKDKRNNNNSNKSRSKEHGRQKPRMSLGQVTAKTEAMNPKYNDCDVSGNNKKQQIMNEQKMNGSDYNDDGTTYGIEEEEPTMEMYTTNTNDDEYYTRLREQDEATWKQSQQREKNMRRKGATKTMSLSCEQSKQTYNRDDSAVDIDQLNRAAIMSNRSNAQPSTTTSKSRGGSNSNKRHTNSTKASSSGSTTQSNGMVQVQQHTTTTTTKKREIDSHPLIQSPLRKHIKGVHTSAVSNATCTMLKEPFPLSLPPTNTTTAAIIRSGGSATAYVDVVRPLAAVAGWDKPTTEYNCLNTLGVMSGNHATTSSIGSSRTIIDGRAESRSSNGNDEGERKEKGEALDLLTSAAFLFKHSRRNLG